MAQSYDACTFKSDFKFPMFALVDLVSVCVRMLMVEQQVAEMMLVEAQHAVCKSLCSQLKAVCV